MRNSSSDSGCRKVRAAHMPATAPRAPGRVGEGAGDERVRSSAESPRRVRAAGGVPALPPSPGDGAPHVPARARGGVAAASAHRSGRGGARRRGPASFTTSEVLVPDAAPGRRPGPAPAPRARGGRRYHHGGDAPSSSASAARPCAPAAGRRRRAPRRRRRAPPARGRQRALRAASALVARGAVAGRGSARSRSRRSPARRCPHHPGRVRKQRRRGGPGTGRRRGGGGARGRHGALAAIRWATPGSPRPASRIGRPRPPPRARADRRGRARLGPIADHREHAVAWTAQASRSDERGGRERGAAAARRRRAARERRDPARVASRPSAAGCLRLHVGVRVARLADHALEGRPAAPGSRAVTRESWPGPAGVGRRPAQLVAWRQSSSASSTRAGSARPPRECQHRAGVRRGHRSRRARSARPPRERLLGPEHGRPRVGGARLPRRRAERRRAGASSRGRAGPAGGPRRRGRPRARCETDRRRSRGGRSRSGSSQPRSRAGRGAHRPDPPRSSSTRERLGATPQRGEPSPRRAAGRVVRGGRGAERGEASVPPIVPSASAAAATFGSASASCAVSGATARRSAMAPARPPPPRRLPLGEAEPLDEQRYHGRRWGERPAPSARAHRRGRPSTSTRLGQDQRRVGTAATRSTAAVADAGQLGSASRSSSSLGPRARARAGDGAVAGLSRLAAAWPSPARVAVGPIVSRRGLRQGLLRRPRRAWRLEQRLHVEQEPQRARARAVGRPRPTSPQTPTKKRGRPVPRSDSRADVERGHPHHLADLVHDEPDPAVRRRARSRTGSPPRRHLEPDRRFACQHRDDLAPQPDHPLDERGARHRRDRERVDDLPHPHHVDGVVLAAVARRFRAPPRRDAARRGAPLRDSGSPRQTPPWAAPPRRAGPAAGARRSSAPRSSTVKRRSPSRRCRRGTPRLGRRSPRARSRGARPEPDHARHGVHAIRKAVAGVDDHDAAGALTTAAGGSPSRRRGSKTATTSPRT